jgi:chain length determinant protein EpsF
MTFIQFFRLLRARWLMLVAGAGLGLVLALGWVLFSDRVYQATAQVLVDVRAPERLDGAVAPQEQLASDYLNTQMDILRSTKVRARVVENLGLAADPAAKAEFASGGATGTIEQHLVRMLGAGLDLVPSTSSRVISINYSAKDPEVAARIANAFAQAYRDVSLALVVEPARQSAGWYQQRADEVQKELVTAQEKLVARQRELGVSADSDQTDADVARLGSLSAQLAQAQAQSAQTTARTGGGALPDAMASPVIQGIQAELAKLEAQRRQLAQIAGPNNVDMVQLNSQIDALRQQLSAQRALISQTASTAAAQSGASVGALAAAVAEQRQRVIEGRSDRSELTLLQRDVENLRQIYEQIVARRAQLGIMGQGSQTNVAILAAAVAPQNPAWPRPMLMLMLGLVLGAVVGGAAAIITELSDQRLRSADDHEAWLGIPNLGTISLSGPPQLQIGAAFRRYLPQPGTS